MKKEEKPKKKEMTAEESVKRAIHLWQRAIKTNYKGNYEDAFVDLLMEFGAFLAGPFVFESLFIASKDRPTTFAPLQVFVQRKSRAHTRFVYACRNLQIGGKRLLTTKEDDAPVYAVELPNNNFFIVSVADLRGSSPIFTVQDFALNVTQMWFDGVKVRSLIPNLLQNAELKMNFAKVSMPFYNNTMHLLSENILKYEAAPYEFDTPERVGLMFTHRMFQYFAFKYSADLFDQMQAWNALVRRNARTTGLFMMLFTLDPALVSKEHPPNTSLVNLVLYKPDQAHTWRIFWDELDDYEKAHQIFANEHLSDKSSAFFVSNRASRNIPVASLLRQIQFPEQSLGTNQKVQPECEDIFGLLEDDDNTASPNVHINANLKTNVVVFMHTAKEGWRSSCLNRELLAKFSKVYYECLGKDSRNREHSIESDQVYYRVEYFAGQPAFITEQNYRWITQNTTDRYFVQHSYQNHKIQFSVSEYVLWNQENPRSAWHCQDGTDFVLSVILPVDATSIEEARAQLESPIVLKQLTTGSPFSPPIDYFPTSIQPLKPIRKLTTNEEGGYEIDLTAKRAPKFFNLEPIVPHSDVYDAKHQIEEHFESEVSMFTREERIAAGIYDPNDYIAGGNQEEEEGYEEVLLDEPPYPLSPYSPPPLEQAAEEEEKKEGREEKAPGEEEDEKEPTYEPSTPSYRDDHLFQQIFDDMNDAWAYVAVSHQYDNYLVQYRQAELRAIAQRVLILNQRYRGEEDINHIITIASQALEIFRNHFRRSDASRFMAIYETFASVMTQELEQKTHDAMADEKAWDRAEVQRVTYIIEDLEFDPWDPIVKERMRLHEEIMSGDIPRMMQADKELRTIWLPDAIIAVQEHNVDPRENIDL